MVENCLQPMRGTMEEPHNGAPQDKKENNTDPDTSLK